MLISFIIPVYNVEKYISECICSLMAQKGEDIEFILVDDGSTDTSGKICDEYSKKDKRIFVVHKANEGVAVARNIGIDVAKGEWISFVDGDDKITNNFVSELRHYIKDSFDIIVFAHDNFDGSNIPALSQDGSTEIFKDSRIEFLQKDCLIHKRSEKREFYYDFGYPWGKLYNTEFIRRNNLHFPVGIKINEDQLFNLCVLKYAKNVLGVHKQLYLYRKNESSITNQNIGFLASTYDRKIEKQNKIINELYPNSAEMKSRHAASCFCTLMQVGSRMPSVKKCSRYLRNELEKDVYKSCPRNTLDCFLSKRMKTCKRLLILHLYRVSAMVLLGKVR